jgi:hypothetical protein
VAGSSSSSRCLHFGGLFGADPRNRGRQRFCHADACTKASKRNSQARWLSQPVNADYFKGPTILTSNRAYKHWQEIFNNDATLTAALLDRLLHHVETIVIEGRSYRTKDQINPT